MNETDHPDDEVLIDRIRALSQPLVPEPTGYPARVDPIDGIRAVVFDVYGTMLISGTGDIGIASDEEDERIFREALAAAGLPAGHLPAELRGSDVFMEAIHAAQRERRAEGVEFPEVDILAVWNDTLAALVEHGIPSISDEQLRALAIENECRANPVWPMPALAQTLDALSGAGMLLGIVSNAQFYTPLLFNALLGASLEELGFDPALCVWSYRMREGKPSARLYERLAAALSQEHGVTPGETLYVGNDQLKDIWPAQQVGFRTALFAGDRRSLRLREGDERCAKTRADLVIDDLPQLLKAIGIAT